MRSTTLGRNRSKLDDNGAARDHLKEAVANTREGVREIGSAAKEVASAEYSRLHDRFATIRDETLAHVSKQPLTSLLVAAGAGVIVGFLLRRR